MPIPIKVSAGAITLGGELFDTARGEAIAAILPIEATRP